MRIESVERIRAFAGGPGRIQEMERLRLRTCKKEFVDEAAADAEAEAAARWKVRSAHMDLASARMSDNRCVPIRASDEHSEGRFLFRHCNLLSGV